MGKKDTSPANPGPEFDPALKTIAQTLSMWVVGTFGDEPGTARALFGAALSACIGALGESMHRKNLEPLTSLVNHVSQWCEKRESSMNSGKTVGDVFWEGEARRTGTNN